MLPIRIEPVQLACRDSCARQQSAGLFGRGSGHPHAPAAWPKARRRTPRSVCARAVEARAGSILRRGPLRLPYSSRSCPVLATGNRVSRRVPSSVRCTQRDLRFRSSARRGRTGSFRGTCTCSGPVGPVHGARRRHAIVFRQVVEQRPYREWAIDVRPLYLPFRKRCPQGLCPGLRVFRSTLEGAWNTQCLAASVSRRKAPIASRDASRGSLLASSSMHESLWSSYSRRFGSSTPCVTLNSTASVRPSLVATASGRDGPARRFDLDLVEYCTCCFARPLQRGQPFEGLVERRPRCKPTRAVARPSPPRTASACAFARTRS